MIELVCIDVDGTLVGASGDVLPLTWEAAADARARGLRLAICSGRPAFGITRELAGRLMPEGWHVFQNGASVVHLPDGLARSRHIAPSTVRMLVERARATGRILEVYGDTEYAVEADTERARRHAGLLGVPFVVRDLLHFPQPVVRMQWVVPHAEADAILAEPHDGMSVARSLAPVMPDTSFIGITPPGIDKAAGVRAVAAAYDIPLERVMMVGDGENDITALQLVGAPVAMGNAESDVRVHARHVVGHVDAGGLAEALALALSLREG